ncbi:hydroxyacid dehydrogenase [Qingshengfaniella alkalisoli]|uniref:Hydroxyacid dehydrogenase n=1 Tax=Qingshengfaniella alkalisoli TaxID=2599296 RepID=A0A5B8J168_9RHOB|nr:hydroxyacid dehydrogenase [Qingshengfaniella alkalisoli]QDY70618.1 hydroxyacid dehydrogenase [Qingshengfaniella alkalisoli]
MPHVLVVGSIHPSGRALLADAPDVTAEFVDGTTEDSYASLISHADALLIRTQPLGAATVAQAEKLRIVSRHGVGYDAVDVDALTKHGIALAVCGDVNSTSVAEHAVMLMLAAAKRAVRADHAVRHGGWGWRDRIEARDLRGQNLLLIGYGRIGRHTARLCAAFGMTIRAFDPVLEASGWPDGEITPAGNLVEGLGWADIVSLSVPSAGKPIIGARELSAMKPGSILINTSRGGVVDEAALVDALHSGQLGAAGLDVFAQEPLPIDHPLTRLDQVVLSPHIAGVTAEASERMAVGAATNILDFFAGRIDPALVVNKEALNGHIET